MQSQTRHRAWSSHTLRERLLLRAQLRSPAQARDWLQSQAHGKLVKARATSAGVAPCAPTPGSSRIARGSNLRASPTARGCVAPMTAPTDSLYCRIEIRAPSATARRPGARHAACGDNKILHLRATRVRGLDDAEDAGSVTAARREERIERISAEIWIHRHRVGERQLAVRRLQIRGGVRARGRARCRPRSRVRNHLQPCRARVGADILEEHVYRRRQAKATCGLTATT